MPALGRVPRVFLNTEFGHEHAVGLDDGQALAAVVVGDHATEFRVLGAFDVEAVAPHLARGHAADGDALGAVIDANAHPSLAGLTLVLGAIAFERSSDYGDVRHVRNREDGIFARVVGERLENRILGKLQRHVALERQAPLLLHRIDHVGALRHEDRSAGAADLVDRRLDGLGIVGAAVALRALVAHIDDKRRCRRHDASLRGSRFRGSRKASDASRSDQRRQEQARRLKLVLANHAGQRTLICPRLSRVGEAGIISRDQGIIWPMRWGSITAVR